MKVNWKNINWLELGRAVAKAVLPFIYAALGGVAVASASGCSSFVPDSKTQRMAVYAFGIPGIAVITSSSQSADNSGDDANTPTQLNPVTLTGAK